MIRSRTVRRLALATAGVLLAATAAAAQEDARPAPGDVEGRVVDAATGAPVVGAWVRVEHPRRAVVSGEDGGFVIPRLPAGEHAVAVGRLGYQDRDTTLVVREGGGRLEVALQAGAVALEAITVQTDRLAARARSTASSLREFGPDELAASPATNAEEFIRGRAGLVSAECGIGRLASAGPNDCVRVRGSALAPCIIVDERPSAGGWAELAMLWPQELHRIDVLAGGAVIQAYTAQYVERMGRRGWSPLPADVLTMTACQGRR